MINSLGIKKAPKDTRVVVAMSGGVDSSVVAGLMKEEGYDVTGITLKLYDDAKSSKEGRQCCAGQDILDAKRVSQKLNIDHKILYYQPGFGHAFLVLSDFADFEYKCTDYYDPEDEFSILWDDPDLSISWPIKNPILSSKDKKAQPFKKYTASLAKNN